MIFFENLQRYKNEILHGVLERKDGSVNPYSNPESGQNILRALQKLDYKNAKVSNLVFAQQPHGSNLHFCPPDIGGYIKLGVDGLITESLGQILVIKTADCLPILMYDPGQKKVAAIHAGRKGLLKGIIENTIEALDSQPSSLIVGIGPHIRRCCYYLKERDQDFILHSQWKKYTEKRGEKLYFDLTQIALDKFLDFGIKQENIEDCGICTFCQAERFFSARRKESEPDFYKKENEKFPCFGSFVSLRKNL